MNLFIYLEGQRFYKIDLSKLIQDSTTGANLVCRGLTLYNIPQSVLHAAHYGTIFHGLNAVLFLTTLDMLRMLLSFLTVQNLLQMILCYRLLNSKNIRGEPTCEGFNPTLPPRLEQKKNRSPLLRKVTRKQVY